MPDEKNDDDVFAQHQQLMEQRLKTVVVFVAFLVVLILYTQLR